MNENIHTVELSRCILEKEHASMSVEVDYILDSARFVVEYANYDPGRDKSKPSRLVQTFTSPSAARAAYDAITNGQRQ